MDRIGKVSGGGRLRHFDHDDLRHLAASEDERDAMNEALIRLRRALAEQGARAPLVQGADRR